MGSIMTLSLIQRKKLKDSIFIAEQLMLKLIASNVLARLTGANCKRAKIFVTRGSKPHIIDLHVSNSIYCKLIRNEDFMRLLNSDGSIKVTVYPMSWWETLFTKGIQLRFIEKS